MKKLFKNSFIALAVLALGISSCTEECDYTPAKPSSVETNDFYFNANQPASELLGIADTVYTVTLERANADEEQTIKINAIANEEIFNIPATATFAAGESTTDIVIGLSEKMEPFKSYKFELSLPMELINPYKTDNNSVCIVTLMKEDYKPYAKAEYVWGFIGGLSHEQIIEKSEYLSIPDSLTQYRMTAPWADPVAADLYVNYVGYGAEEGEDVYFTVNETTGEIIVDPATIKTGVIHPSYGSVTANFEKGQVQGENLLFQYKWTVSAGSFGSMVDQVKITEQF